jgi:uncharacterized protein (TIGR02001 family)
MRLVVAATGFAVLCAAPALHAEDAPYLITDVELAQLDDERFGGLRHPNLPDEGASMSPKDEDFTVEATLSLVSDFRRGGISSSAGKTALQGSIGVEHKSGFYGSAWASNVAGNGGADVEIDLALGYNFNFGDLDASIGVIDYVFPGVRNSNYVELQAGLSTKVGLADISLSMAYTPRQSNVGGQDNLYVGVSGAMRATDRLGLNGTIGVEDGAFGNRKVDWSLGATYLLKGIELGVTYVDATRTFDAPDSEATVVFSVGKTF